MTVLDTLRDWIKTYPNFSAVRDCQVDYTCERPGNGGVFPDGVVEIGRSRDILGNVTVTNQHNFDLLFVFAKSPGDDIGASANAAWVADFQDWVQEQSARRLTPVFGDDPRKEKIMAQNGTLYDVKKDGTAVYMVQISIQFIKKFAKGDV